jgi:hypothetical protein
MKKSGGRTRSLPNISNLAPAHTRSEHEGLVGMRQHEKQRHHERSAQAFPNLFLGVIQ